MNCATLIEASYAFVCDSRTYLLLQFNSVSN